jgi:hypothetical protein
MYVNMLCMNIHQCLSIYDYRDIKLYAACMLEYMYVYIYIYIYIYTRARACPPAFITHICCRFLVTSYGELYRRICLSREQNSKYTHIHAK